MNNWLKQNWLILLLTFLPLIFGLLVFDQLPEELPIHWNAAGEVDNTLPKLQAILLLPGIVLGTNLVFWLIPFIDKSQEIKDSSKVLHIVQVCVTLLVSSLGISTILIGMGYDLDIPTLVPVGVLLLMMVIGNYMGKVRPNKFMGIRTPWTLKNDEVWRRTHKVSGWVWVGISAALLGARFLMETEIFIYLFIGGILAMVLVPMIYSWRVYQELEG